MRVPSLQSQTRAAMFACGFQAAIARNRPSLATMRAVSPAEPEPSTRATAPEKTQGCRRSSDFSRPAFKTILITRVRRGDYGTWEKVRCITMEATGSWRRFRL